MARITYEQIIKYAKQMRNCKDINIYEYLKKHIHNLNLPPERYEETIKEIAEILGV